MAEDWSVDVKKYVPDADDGIIAGIVRYCGIALQKRDSSLVSFSDRKETDRVRENFLKKKLGLTDSDADLDGAIAGVGERMKADHTKNRVTVYYLLAEHFGKLAMFDKSAAKTAASEAPATGGGSGTGIAGEAGAAAAALGVAGAGAAAGLAGAGPDNAVPLAARTGSETAVAGGSGGEASARPVAPPEGTGASAQRFAGGASADAGGAGSGGLRWLAWLVLAAIILALLWYLFLRHPAQAPQAASADVSAPAVASGAAPDSTSAPNGAVPSATGAAPAAVAIPTGAGVTTETRDGKPVVNVYFDTGKTAVAPAFGPAAASLKSYLDANAGSTLSVSGYNDKTGNAALNAELSKNRAKAVQAALVAANVPAASIELAKPADTTDTGASNAQARRVEVVVK